jgi:hypothetical protein
MKQMHLAMCDILKDNDIVQHLIQDPDENYVYLPLIGGYDAQSKLIITKENGRFSTFTDFAAKNYSIHQIEKQNVNGREEVAIQRDGHWYEFIETPCDGVVNINERRFIWNASLLEPDSWEPLNLYIPNT